MIHVEFIGKSRATVKIAVIVSFVVISVSAMASGQVRLAHVNDTTKRTEVFIDYEQPPQFRGGNAALMKYLQDNVKYPPQAIRDNVQGRVVVQMLIDSLGYVGDVKVVRSVREDLDQEAVRVVKSLPRFSPGRQFGKCVNVRYTLPVTFKLKDSDAPNLTTDVEPKPEFPGGNADLRQSLNNHVNFQSELLKSWYRGWVDVDILVDSTGRVNAVNVDESFDEGLDSEVVRVLQTLPRFIPCCENGKPVSKWVKYTVFYSRDPERPIMLVR